MKDSNNLSFKEITLICVIFLIIAGSAGCVGYTIGAGSKSFFERNNSRLLTSADLQTAYTTITHNYNGTINQNTLIGNGIKGMVSGLGDTYSYFLTQRQYSQTTAENNGKYYGLGIVYSFRNKNLIITDVLPNSPAEKASISPESTVLAINTTQVFSLTNQTDVANLFASSKTFSLLIQSPDGEQKKYTLEKKYFTASNIVYKKLANEYSYIKIYQFSSTLDKEFIPIAKRIASDKPKKILIDLRNNPGGEQDTEVFLANQFLQKGIIIQEKYKVHSLDNIIASNGKALFPNTPLILLVNAQTASAAEVFTAAIHDNKRGIVIGEKTYGKGTIGQYFVLPDGSALRLTIGQWFTPKGLLIQERGITPDYLVTDTNSNGKDNLLLKALSL